MNTYNNTDLSYLIETRRYLHKHPELSLKEYNTAKFIRNELSRFGIEYRTVGETGTFAKIDGKAPGKTVLLRADIDALPIREKTGLAFSSENEGVMHACGHDLHTAALLGAARELSARRENFSGTVLLAFQQAEESQHGSKFFEQEGLTKGYDRAFGIHISPAFPVGKIAMTRGTDAASCDYFKITLRGKSVHISKPHLGRDALAAAAELALKLPSIQPRKLDPLDSVVIGIGKLTAGTSYNIIANEAVLEGSFRTLTLETQEFLQNEVRKTAETVAALYNVDPEIELETFAYPVINDDDAFDEAYAAAVDVVGKENVITDKKLIMGFGADDFSAFARHAKGVYVHVGTANETENSKLPLHSDKLTPDERALMIMKDLHIRYATIHADTL